jgi:uncharacterized cupin superfamily protein
MADHPNVVGDQDVEWSEHSHGEKFGYRRKSLGSAAGGDKLGCSLYEVPPGRRAWRKVRTSSSTPRRRC